MDLATFDKRLRSLVASDAHRPFVCDGSPLACSAFIVGVNPATPMQNAFFPYWSALSGFDKTAWLAAYTEERMRQPLKPGKKRRIAKSNSRRNIDWISAAALPTKCLETNLFGRATKEQRHLRPSDMDSRVFSFLIDSIKPLLVVLHGEKARRFARQRWGFEIPLDSVTAVETDTRVLCVNHLSRHWSRQRAEDLGRRIHSVCSGA